MRNHKITIILLVIILILLVCLLVPLPLPYGIYKYDRDSYIFFDKNGKGYGIWHLANKEYSHLSTFFWDRKSMLKSITTPNILSGYAFIWGYYSSPERVLKRCFVVPKEVNDVMDKINSGNVYWDFETNYFTGEKYQIGSLLKDEFNDDAIYNNISNQNNFNSEDYLKFEYIVLMIEDAFNSTELCNFDKKELRIICDDINYNAIRKLLELLKLRYPNIDWTIFDNLKFAYRINYNVLRIDYMRQHAANNAIWISVSLNAIPHGLVTFLDNKNNFYPFHYELIQSETPAVKRIPND